MTNFRRRLDIHVYTADSRYLEVVGTIFYKFKLPEVQINLHFGQFGLVKKSQTLNYSWRKQSKCNFNSDRRFEFRRIRDIRVRDSESRLYLLVCIVQILSLIHFVYTANYLQLPQWGMPTNAAKIFLGTFSLYPALLGFSSTFDNKKTAQCSWHELTMIGICQWFCPTLSLFLSGLMALTP